MWKTVKGVVWFLSLIWWQILLGAAVSMVAYEKNHLMNVRGANPSVSASLCLCCVRA